MSSTLCLFDNLTDLTTIVELQFEDYENLLKNAPTNWKSSLKHGAKGSINILLSNFSKLVLTEPRINVNIIPSSLVKHFHVYLRTPKTPPAKERVLELAKLYPPGLETVTIPNLLENEAMKMFVDKMASVVGFVFIIITMILFLNYNN